MPKKHATYPNEFFDQLQRRVGVVNDYQLSRIIHVDASAIKRIREGGLNLSAGNLLNIYDTTGWSIEELRTLLYQRPIHRTSWNPIQTAIPNLCVVIKAPEDTADILRARMEVHRLRDGIPKRYERKPKDYKFNSPFAE